MRKTKLGLATKVEIIVRTGIAQSEIVQAAKDLQNALIIIGGYGGGPPMGSTAEYVVRHAPCPVLVVRNQDERLPNGCSETAAVHLAARPYLNQPSTFS